MPAATVDDIRAAVARAGAQGTTVTPLGGGFSIGDVNLNGTGFMLDVAGLATVGELDHETGRLVAGAGVRVHDVLTVAMPAGWRLVGLSGSSQDTMGGALAGNTHGKDTWWAGNFADNVVSLRLMTADGEVRNVDRHADPDLFHAVTGSLGTLGVIVEVTLQLTPVPSVAVERTTDSCSGFTDLVARMRALEPAERTLCYVEVDGLGGGSSEGSGLLHHARFTDASTDTERAAFVGALRTREHIAGLPARAFWALARQVYRESTLPLFRPIVVRRYLGGGAHARRGLYSAYQFPQIALPDLNRLFLPSGAIECQALFGWDRAADAFAAMLATARRHGRRVWVCGVKRHLPSPSPLTFAGDGLSMTIVMGLNGITAAAREDLQRALVDVVRAHEGRIYLSKFAYMTPDDLQAMYPRATELLALKSRLDPEGIFYGDATARLLRG